MPDIKTPSQIFDLAFHPTRSLVFTGQLTGELNAYSYNALDSLSATAEEDSDDSNETKLEFKTKLSKKSIRGLTVSEDGDRVWAIGKSKALYMIDTRIGKVSDLRKGAHDTAINRVKRLRQNLLSTGDDDGVVKLWDPRQRDATQAYTHHFDFISDFLWLEDKKHLVCTSGDGTLSVLDIRSKKTTPFAQSEDQEDELLSIVAIKGGQKLVLGTQLGILSIFNRKSGWGDCVDRIPGHPHSIDALCNIPSHYSDAESTILTGSSDGLLRAVQILPTKLLGVVADHGEFPIERIAVDKAGEGRWVGSVGHDEYLKLTDLKAVFEDEGEEDESDGEGDSHKEEEEEAQEGLQDAGLKFNVEDSDNEDSEEDPGEVAESDSPKVEPASKQITQERDSDSEAEAEPSTHKRRRKKDKDLFKTAKRSKGRNELDAEAGFFADL